MQLCITLPGQIPGRFDDIVIDTSHLAVRMGRIDRRDNYPRQRAPDFADQMDRHRAIAQQVPIQGRDKYAPECGFVVHILDDQVWLHLCHLPQDFPQDIAGQNHVRSQGDAIAAYDFGFILQPFLVLLLADFTKMFVSAHQAERVDIFDEYRHVQCRVRGLGNCNRPLQRRRMAHGRPGNHEDTLIRAHVPSNVPGLTATSQHPST
ncbi:hypothetical protein D3C85_1135710 [compost metagenome]